MKPFTADDLLLHQEVTSLHCAYEANLTACAVESIDRDNDTTTSSIWVFPMDSGEPMRMTTAGTHDTLPRWSPDGEQLGFVSDRAGANQIFVISRHGGEARQLSTVDGVVLSFKWSPTGDRILAACSLQVDPNLRGERPAAGQAVPPADAPQLVWKLPYKVDGMGYSLGHEIHLFCIDAASGTATQVTDGPFNASGADWSPDGRHIVHVRSRQGE